VGSIIKSDIAKESMFSPAQVLPLGWNLVDIFPSQTNLSED